MSGTPQQAGPPVRATGDDRALDGLDPRAASARRLAASGAGLRALDRLADLAGGLLGASAAQISVISDVQTVAGAGGGAAFATGQESAAVDSLCTVTTAALRPVVVSDANRDTRVSELPPVTSGNVGAYLGVPLVAGDGHTIGALCVYESHPREWTEQDVALLEQLAAPVVAELELAALSSDYESDQLVWQLAVDAAGIGAWDWNLRTGSLRWDDRLLELFGITAAEFGGTIEDFHRFVHPDDADRVDRALDQAIRTCGSYAVEHRLLLPDGTVRWIASRGQALAGPGGETTRLLGAAYDVSATYDSEARVARVLDEMPSAVLHLDGAWRVSYANPEAERVLGLGRDQLVGSSLWDLFPEAIGTDFETQYRHAVESRQPVAFDAYYPAPLDAWFEVRAWPTAGGLSLYFIDVTARHARQQQLAETARRHELLAQVTDALATLDADEAAGRLAPLLTAQLADWCVVTLVDQANPTDWRSGLRDVGVSHADPARRATVERYAAVRMGALTDDSFLARVISQRRPLVVPRDATAAISAVLAPGEARALLAELAPESALVVPLKARGRTAGVLSVFRGAGRPAFSQDARDTLVELADRAGLALDNARLYAEQRDLAEGLQRSLMTAPPEPDHFEVVVRYEPAAETAQVGGDWYDAFLQRDGATVMVIGDVVGHDTAAAAAMGQVRGLLRGIAVHTGEGPAAVLQGVDRVMETLLLDTTATGIVARLEHEPPGSEPGTTRLCWSNAGHPPPMAITEAGEVTVLAGEPDLLLGLDPETRRTQAEVTLRRGTTLLLYTDGLVERRGQPLDEGLDRLHDLLADLAARRLGLGEMCDEVLHTMQPRHPEDDVALVAVRLQG